MSSPLDSSEVEALMQAIQDGRVSPEPGGGARGPIVPYDLTSQDRIIRGQMPTLDTINDKLASIVAKTLSARTRLDLRVASMPATLLKFVDVQASILPPTTVGVLSLGPGHGMSLLVLEGDLAPMLLAGAMGDRKARPAAPAPDGSGRQELTNVERVVLKHLATLFAEAMKHAWVDTIAFGPEVMRFESDPRLTVIAAPSDVAVLCPFEISGAIEGRLQVVIPYASLEPAKKLLASPPRVGGPQGDARFSAALARELDEVNVELCVEIGQRRLSLAELLALEVGNVLTLTTSESAPLPVFVQGRLKMTAAPRVVAGGMAVEVVQTIETHAREARARGRGEPKAPAPGSGSGAPPRGVKAA
jgi:flagellar motor switch protein FliM